MKKILRDDAWGRSLGRVTDAAAIICGWWLIVLAAMTCVEMVGRKLLSFSLQGIDEIGSYTYAIVGAVGFAFALVTRSHTRVDFLLGRFPERGRAWLNVLAAVGLAAASVLCVWRSANVLAESIDLGASAATPLATPLWIPQAIWLAGWVLFALVACTAAWDAVGLLSRGATPLINERFGPQTLEEEIEAETELHVGADPRRSAP